MTEYYTTKLSRDEWMVSGKRHHIQIDRTEAPTGRADQHGEDMLQTIYHVHDRSGVIDTSDQYDTDPHGFTRLKDATRYAIEKLAEYDNRVDPKKKPRQNPEKIFRFSELGREHQHEIVGNLGRNIAQSTVWKLVPDFPVDIAAALANDTAIQILDSDIESIIEAIRNQGGVKRPILIDELDEEEPWMEGRHRSLASQEMGLRTIPALYRIE